MISIRATGIARQAVLMSILLFSGVLPTQSIAQGNVTIVSPWSREMPPNVSNGAVYFRADNPGAEPDRLLGARTDIAERVEIHTHDMEGGMMTMREVRSVELSARSELDFKPHGLHLMLIGLKQPLASGAHFGLTVVLEKAGEMDLMVEIKPVDFVVGEMDHTSQTTHQTQVTQHGSNNARVVPVHRISD